MASPRPTQGLRTSVRSPGSIQNDQHHDATATQRGSDGKIGAIERVIADSTVKTAIQDNQPLWVVNRDTVVHYLFVGKDSETPGTVDDTNGMALPAGEGFLIFSDKSDDDQQSIVVKTDSSQVHITVLKN